MELTKFQEGLELLAIMGKKPKKPIKKPKNQRFCQLKLCLPKPTFEFFYWQEIILPVNLNDFCTYNKGLFGQPAALNLTKHVTSVETDLKNKQILVTLENRGTPQTISLEQYLENLRQCGTPDAIKLSGQLSRLFYHEHGLSSIKTREQLESAHHQISQRLNSFSQISSQRLPSCFMKTIYTSPPIDLARPGECQMSITSVIFSGGLVKALGYSSEEFRFKILRTGLPKIFKEASLEMVLMDLEMRACQSAGPLSTVVQLDGLKSVIHCYVTIYSHFYINELNQRVIELIHEFNMESSLNYPKKSQEQLDSAKTKSPKEESWANDSPRSRSDTSSTLDIKSPEELSDPRPKKKVHLCPVLEKRSLSQCSHTKVKRRSFFWLSTHQSSVN